MEAPKCAIDEPRRKGTRRILVAIILLISVTDGSAAEATRQLAADIINAVAAAIVEVAAPQRAYL